jgi:membrane dipeptidase
MAEPARLRFADSHNDLLLAIMHQRERGRADPFGDFWLPQLRSGGVVLQVLPIYTEDQFLGEGALRRALRIIETARWMAELHAADVAIVTTATEMRSAIDGGRIALILAFEGMEPVGRDLDVIDTFWHLGIRLAGMTWNRRTMFADGMGEDGTGAGLTSVGVAALSRMEALGMTVDVSHLSDAGFEHIARAATRPFVASHSSCRAVHAHPRNLEDEQLRAVAASGGFVGLNATGFFLAAEPTLEDYLAHAAHAISVIGSDHVGLGLDFVVDLFEQVDPILSGLLIDSLDLPHIEGLLRPSDLPTLAPLLVDRLGREDAERVASRTLIEAFGRLLPV